MDTAITLQKARRPRLRWVAAGVTALTLAGVGAAIVAIDDRGGGAGSSGSSTPVVQDYDARQDPLVNRFGERELPPDPLVNRYRDR